MESNYFLLKLKNFKNKKTFIYKYKKLPENFEIFTSFTLAFFSMSSEARVLITASDIDSAGIKQYIIKWEWFRKGSKAFNSMSSFISMVLLLHYF